MATAAPSPLASSVEKTNGAKLSKLLIDGGTTVLRKVFDGFHPPVTLAADLNACYSTLNNLLRRKILNRHQWDQLFPPGGATPDSNTFDITLLFLLLTNICGLSPPPSGWHKKPPPTDISPEANLARVKHFRNVLYGHVSATGVDTPTFNALWQEISAPLVVLGLNQAEIDRLKAEHGGEEDYVDALLEWADSEEDVKSQLKNIHHTQSQAQQTIEDVLDTQIKAKQAIEEFSQIQTKTQLTVDEVAKRHEEHYEALQAGLREVKEAVGSCNVRHTQSQTQQTVEDVLETQTKAKQAIEEFSQIQTKTQQTVGDVLETQTEAKQAIEEFSQIQTKTQQTVDEVAKRHEEHYEALQAGLREVKEAVGSCNVHHTQSQTQQTVEDVLETQTKAKQAIEEFSQIQTKTQQTVGDVLETQTEAKQAIEEFSQIQTKTQQTVDEVAKRHEEHYEALQAGLREVKEAVGSCNVHHTQSQTQQTVEDVLETQTKAKQAIEEFSQIQTKTQQTVGDVLETQTEAKQVIEEFSQIQTKTQQTVDEVAKRHEEHYEALQAGLREVKEAVGSCNVHHTMSQTQQTVEDVLETQTKAKQAIEDFSHIQTKTQQTVDEVAERHEEHYEALQAGLREVKKAVDSFKEGKEKDSTDEVLRNLAKSEFKGDIEYYLERFQTDTREWVFNRVQNWLDDRNSENRVMVISGNAGMGKSVIAAVICQRMQEADRLSGNHFCQHNNSRYQNPQLMLQSLACHLSRTLPEYKQALVEQLTRNLGLDLNSMGVEELFALLFREPLSTVGDPGRNMLMVIDGLDESEYQGRNELLDVIANQFCKLPSWIRFLVTSRPATKIMDKLKHLKPFQLDPDDEKNVDDIRAVLLKRIQRVIAPENVDAVVEKLVLKSEGLMLYAHFLMLYIEENPSVLSKADLDKSLPLGISAVYSSYFKRLELEPMKELIVQEENFLNLLCAITASREPLPLDFVSKLLVPNRNSPLAKRKVLTAISSVSSLLPIRDGCLHVIHKSVIDWMTDSSCYGKHDFIMDEKEGNRILANLCTGELDDLKQRGVHNIEFSATEKYALCHGARHLLQSVENGGSHRLEELTKAYVVDLELVFAKLSLNNFSAAEDVVWLQKQGISAILSEDIQSNLKTLLFLLRKHYDRLTSHPHLFLQTVLNEGGTVLSSEASTLLLNLGIPCMEYVHKETQQGAVIACFKCSSVVVCFDVSPSLDHMVCECDDGMLQLWSLQTGRLLWERPVQVPKSFRFGRYRLSRSGVGSFYRSVVFHPTEDLVLPGILSHAYTIKGDLKPLFLQSYCRFSVCSISADKTKVLTNCSENAKCLVMWSLDNGSEIARIIRDEDVLSFAWSRDGRLLAISHSTGLISLVDVMRDFTTVAETTSSPVCGRLKFTPDSQVLFLYSCDGFLRDHQLTCCSVVEEKNRNFSLQVSSNAECYDPSKFESFSDCGFLLGDLIPASLNRRLAYFLELTFVINKHLVLRTSRRSGIVLINTNNVVSGRQSVAERALDIALSLDGQTVYVVSEALPPIFLFCTLMACEVSSGKVRGEKPCKATIRPFPVRRGVLLNLLSGTLELWTFDLSECIQRWINLAEITNVIPISDERVACVTNEGDLIVLDTSSGEILSTISTLHKQVVTCNSKLQIISIDEGVLQLSDGTAVLWKKELPLRKLGVMFSPGEQFLVIFQCDVYPFGDVHILDAASGNSLHLFSLATCKFLSDDQCVVYHLGGKVELYNVTSGHVLSVVDVDGDVNCLAACPSQRLVAIGLRYSSPNFKVIRVWLPGDKDNMKSKR